VNIRSIRIPAENSPDARRIFIDDNPASRWRRFISASSKRRNLTGSCIGVQKCPETLVSSSPIAIDSTRSDGRKRNEKFAHHGDIVDFGLILSTREQSSHANAIFSYENSCSVTGYRFCNASDYWRASETRSYSRVSLTRLQIWCLSPCDIVIARTRRYRER